SVGVRHVGRDRRRERRVLEVLLVDADDLRAARGQLGSDVLRELGTRSDDDGAHRPHLLTGANGSGRSRSVSSVRIDGWRVRAGARTVAESMMPRWTSTSLWIAHAGPDCSPQTIRGSSAANCSRAVPWSPE